MCLPHTPLHDVYYNSDYASLFLKGSDELFEYSYKQDDHWLSNLSIKRRIDKVGDIKISEELYDLETPYGYGGFRTNSNNLSFLSQAWHDYQKTCQSANIVAEFVRCHPFFPTPPELTNHWDLYGLDRETVYVNLAKPYDSIRASYNSSIRRNLKKAAKNELVFAEITDMSNAQASFESLYELTMLRNNAKDFFFFSHSHIKKLLRIQKTKMFAVFHEDTPINILITLESDNFLHYHLGASCPNRYHLCGNPFLFDSIIKFYSGREMLFHLGGGRTTLPDDQLLRFKKNFSSLQANFMIGGIIHDCSTYNKLNSLITNLVSCQQFLTYRYA